MGLWYTEKHRLGFGITYKIKRTLADEQTEFQKLELVDTEAFGRMLLLDGLVMTTVFDEFIYHEMITHPPLCTHPNPRRVLVIGGGDGGTVREVLRHPSVESVELCEIDRRVVEVCREYLPEPSCGLRDPRVSIVYADGIEYVKNAEAKYDCIIVDSTDPIGPAVGLFSLDFYKSIYRALTDDGVFSAQTESPLAEPDFVRKVTHEIGSVFPVCGLYTAAIQTYPGALWSFTIGSKRCHPVNDAREVPELKGCRHYHYGLHRAMFDAVPKFARELLPDSFV